jgi:hypothetical protein
LIRKVLPLAAALAFTFTAAAAHAQDEPAPSALDKQLSRIDFAISGAGEFNKSVSGPVTAQGSGNTGQIVGDSASNTFGALVTLRYIVKPYFGLEGNYGYARYTQNYSNVPGNQSGLGVQAQTNEYTLGYVLTPPHLLFGLQPFASVGAGTMAFKPTPRGGISLSTQARATYYYSAGLQQEFFSPHFGFRASFRQNFFLAPDFGQNYLTIKQRTTTLEPTLGFYFKF